MRTRVVKYHTVVGMLADVYGGHDHDFNYNLIKMLGIVITNAEASVGNSKYLVFHVHLCPVGPEYLIPVP